MLEAKEDKTTEPKRSQAIAYSKLRAHWFRYTVKDALSRYKIYIVLMLSLLPLLSMEVLAFPFRLVTFVQSAITPTVFIVLPSIWALWFIACIAIVLHRKGITGPPFSEFLKHVAIDDAIVDSLSFRLIIKFSWIWVILLGVSLLSIDFKYLGVSQLILLLLNYLWFYSQLILVQFFWLISSYRQLFFALLYSLIFVVANSWVSEPIAGLVVLTITVANLVKVSSIYRVVSKAIVLEQSKSNSLNV